MSRTRLGVLVSAVLAAGSVFGVSQAIQADGPFGPIRVGVNRRQYTGDCPAEIIYTATINLTMPHPQGFVFNYHWERSDGAKTAVRIVRPPQNQKAIVVRDTWQLGSPRLKEDASETIFVNSGDSHFQQASPAVRVVCR